jgi:hypothetical protein
MSAPEKLEEAEKNLRKAGFKVTKIGNTLHVTYPPNFKAKIVFDKDKELKEVYTLYEDDRIKLIWNVVDGEYEYVYLSEKTTANYYEFMYKSDEVGIMLISDFLESYVKDIYGHIYYTFDIPLGYMLDEIKEKYPPKD